MSKKIVRTISLTASAPIAPFKQNFRNIYRASATYGNWSVSKPKELCILNFKPTIYDRRLNLYDF